MLFVCFKTAGDQETGKIREKTTNELKTKKANIIRRCHAFTEAYDICIPQILFRFDHPKKILLLNKNIMRNAQKGPYEICHHCRPRSACTFTLTDRAFVICLQNQWSALVAQLDARLTGDRKLRV